MVETLTGTPTGTNGSDGLAVYTLPSGNVPANELVVHDGQVRSPGIGYVTPVTSASITFLAPYIPLAGSPAPIIYYGGSVAVGTLSPGLTTLGTVRLLAQQRCDLVGSNFITTPEWNSYIGSSQTELYDLLVRAYDSHYFVAPPYTITTDGTSDQYPLPPDLYKLVGVDLQLGVNGSTDWVSLKRFNFAERNRYGTYPSTSGLRARSNLRYTLVGNNLRIVPRASAGRTLQVWYVPRLQPAIVDTDIIEGVNGWEELIVLDACIKAMVKEESDPSAFVGQKQAMMARINAMSEERDAGSPPTVVDVTGSGAGWARWECEE